MSFKDKKPEAENYNIQVWGDLEDFEGYPKKEMDEYLAIVEPLAEKLEAIETAYATLMNYNCIATQQQFASKVGAILGAKE